MGIIKPKKLKQGDTIGIMGPSGWGDPQLMQQAAEFLRNFGFKVYLHPQTGARSFVSAGKAQERISALHDLFLNPDIDAIFAMKGGLRSMQMLDGIDYDIIRNNPKIFVGYSDVTFLLSTFFKRAGLVTFHGLTLSRYRAELVNEGHRETLDFLQNKAGNVLWPQATMEILREGQTEGTLFGGNLCLVSTLLAMDEAYRPDLKNKILLIEDIGEETRQIDRMLMTLKLSGAWNDMAGLVIGHMNDIADTGDNYKFNCTVRDLVLEHTEGWDRPVIFGAPFGHDAPNLPFPVGVRAKLSAPENDKPTLELLESPFAD